MSSISQLMLPDGERNSPPAAVCMGTNVVLPAVVVAAVAGGAGAVAGGAGAVAGAAVVATGAEVAGPVVGLVVVVGTAGELELQAARTSAAASSTALVLTCLPVVLMAARYPR